MMTLEANPPVAVFDSDDVRGRCDQFKNNITSSSARCSDDKRNQFKNQFKNQFCLVLSSRCPSLSLHLLLFLTLASFTTNADGAVSAMMDVVVYRPSVSFRAPVELYCIPSKPQVQLRWVRDDAEIITNDKYTVNTANSSLVIKHIGEADLGQYNCQEGDESEATITLQAAPYVKSFEKSRNLNVGSVLDLICLAWASPAPSVTWYANDAPLVVDGVRVTVSNTTSGLQGGRLVINDLTYADRKRYTCSASNEYGSYNSTILVRVKSKLAALWPIIGIIIQVIIVAIIIFFYERRLKKEREEEPRREDEKNRNLSSKDGSKQSGDVRQRH